LFGDIMTDSALASVRVLC